MRKPKKILDLYPRPFVNGIFYFMSKSNKFTELFSQLGMTTDEEIHSMDVDYILNHSGLKTLSILMDNIISQYVFTENYVLDPEGNRLTFKQAIESINTQVINIIIYNRFYTKWLNLVKTIKYDYDPLSPYKMDVEESGNDTSVKSTEDSNSYTNSSTDKGTTTSNEKKNESRNAFDSDSAVPTNSSETDTTNGIDTTNIQNGNNSRNTTEDTKRLTGRTISRVGNIGNHTMQELVDEQRQLLQYQIFDTIFEDLDSVLTRSRYYI